MTVQPFLLDGHPFRTRDTQRVENPYDNSTVGEICLAGEAEVHRALEVAHRTFAATRRQSPEERSHLLQRTAEAIGRRTGEFTDLLVAEAGKPVSLARLEVQRARSTFAFAAAEARLPHEHEIAMDATPAGAGHTGLARRFPLGVILGITPFNFPLNLVAHKVAPCLATGNTMILKPALKTPLCTLLLGEVLAECGMPSGQITFLPFRHEHVPPILRDRRVKMLSFTGGDEPGWRLKTLAVKQRVALELGGNAACVVEPDGPWRQHVGKMVVGAFSYAGQSCISVQRIFVHAEIAAEFRERFLAETKRLALTGDPRKESTMVGPMITDAALQRTVERIRQAEALGARLLTLLRVEGRVLSPVVLDNVPHDTAIASEEAFAPVVVLQDYQDFGAALEAVNASRFGLQAGVFTDDPDKIVAAYNTLEVGGVLINQVPTFRTENMPYGGVKDSGLGREGVRYAMEEMTEWKTLVINKSQR